MVMTCNASQVAWCMIGYMDYIMTSIWCTYSTHAYVQMICSLIKVISFVIFICMYKWVDVIWKCEIFYNMRCIKCHLSRIYKYTINFRWYVHQNRSTFSIPSTHHMFDTRIDTAHINFHVTSTHHMSDNRTDTVHINFHVPRKWPETCPVLLGNVMRKCDILGKSLVLC